MVDLTLYFKKSERDHSYSFVCHTVSDMVFAKCIGLSDSLSGCVFSQ